MACLSRCSSFVILRTIFFAVAFCTTISVRSQLCNGSLGDPAVNITFGNGGSTGYTPTDGYTYTSTPCPNDGFYTITNYTSDCFGNTWHTVVTDHTGGGYFMLVNASYTPGDFFLTTVTDLCPNTNYEFAAWIMNVLSIRGIKPNVTFSIETPDGVLLQQFSTGDIYETSRPEWKQYGFYFTTPADNPIIVLRITNNAPGGLGNDLALDDITFRPCGPIIKTAIQGNSDTVDICKGNATQYTFTGDASADYVMPSYIWQQSYDSGKTWRDIPGANTLTYLRQPTGVGRYWYRLTVTEQRSAGIPSCRIASNNLIINVHDDPFVNAGPDRILLAGDTIHLAAIVEGENPSYYWSPADQLSDINVPDAVATSTKNTTYTLFAESEFGCKNNDEVFIKVVAGIFVPSAFTPNNDGKNDRWHIPYLDPLLGATVSLYNRHGQLVYHTEGQTVDWDGNLNGVPQQSGTYVYLIHFKKKRPDMKGTVTLIR
ncbi:MAG: gliding motility-associated C-terminal domain-containing protein [Bacteroidota bacterium]